MVRLEHWPLSNRMGRGGMHVTTEQMVMNCMRWCEGVELVCERQGEI